MDKDITINGVTYENVKNIVVQSEDGENEVIFNETSGATADDDDVTAGETYYADGEERTGTHECDASSEGGSGADGKSAYQIAVDNGFEGTEEEWLASLVGPQGPKGDTGADGKSAYQIAQENGYSGTEETFNSILSSLGIDVGNIYIGTTEPTVTVYKLWVDNSDEDNVLLKYKISTGEWIPISSGSGNGNSGSNINGNILWENIDNKPFDSRKPFEDIDWSGDPADALGQTNVLAINMDGTPIDGLYYKVSDEYDIIPTDLINCEVGMYSNGSVDNIIFAEDDIEDAIIEFDTEAFSIYGYCTIVKSDNKEIDFSFLTGIEGTIVTFPEKGVYYMWMSLQGDPTPLMYLTYAHPAEIVDKLDYKFIHHPDWNQTDKNGDGYIKNRPFYGIKMDSIYWDGNEYEFPSTEFTFNGITSKCYKVIDGNEYKKYGFSSIYDFIYRITLKENIRTIYISDENGYGSGATPSNTSITITYNYPMIIISWDNVPIILCNYSEYSYNYSGYNVSLDPGMYFCHTYINNTEYSRASIIEFYDIVLQKLDSRYININTNTTNSLNSSSTSSEIPTAYAVVQYVENCIGGAINAAY